MESHPKVITVSYGTFSCTLEGFDDPFTTMQLVAEYFRKLASEDRYFGGEPLQPDANILHRIAADANPYKVDAEVTDDGVTLRKAEVVDAEEDEKPEVTNQAAQEEMLVEEEKRTPAPLFVSKRTPEVDVPPADPAEELEDSADESFVEAAVFSSRRVDLSAGENEPTVSAAQMLSDEDEIDFAEVEEEETPVEEAPDASKPDAEAPVEVDPIDVAASVAAAMPDAEDAEMEDASAQVSLEVDVEPEVAPVAEVAETTTDEDIQKEEEALERLLETTNSKMESPENARKSNALERLKAAVAATEAERRLRTGIASQGRTERPKPVDTSVDADEFRKKITEARDGGDDIVSFSRPKSQSRTERPRGNIATLILGQDQRVEPDAEEAAEPRAKKPEATAADAPQTASNIPASKPPLKIIRDENITPDDWAYVDDDAAETNDAASKDLVGDVPTQAGEFSKFAEKLGASSLHELLEASAAYLSLIEEAPRYSQDRIIANIADYLAANSVSDDQMTRSFNRMMRDGRLLRVKSDRYTLSKSARSGYQDRLAG